MQREFTPLTFPRQFTDYTEKGMIVYVPKRHRIKNTTNDSNRKTLWYMNYYTLVSYSFHWGRQVFSKPHHSLIVYLPKHHVSLGR